MPKTKFTFLKNRGERYAQSFDKDNIYLEKAGKKFNLYQAIQDAREDTEIYPTLEKYGCLDRITYEPANAEQYYQDYRNAMDLRNVLDQQKQAENLWLNLPLEVRQKFNHSQHEFVEKGGAWLQSEIKAYQEELKNRETSGLKIPPKKENIPDGIKENINE